MTLKKEAEEIAELCLLSSFISLIKHKEARNSKSSLILYVEGGKSKKKDSQEAAANEQGKEKE